MKPLTTVDTSFLLAEHSAMPMHTAGLLLFSYPKGAREHWLHEVLSDATDASAVQPPFNQKIVWPASRFGRPHWVADPGLDIEYHVRHSALPKPGRYREMFSLISRLHSTRLHRDRPLWEVHIIEGVEQERFAMYIKTHHSMVDGVGSMRLLQSILSADPTEINMPPPWEARRQPPRPVDPSAPTRERQRPAAKAMGTARGLARFAQRVGKTDDHGMVAPFQAPKTMFNGKVSASRRFVAQSYALSRIRSVGKSLDATINDIVLAMSGGALRRYLMDQGALPARSLTAMTPVSIRPDGGEEAGNAFSTIFTTLATDVPDPIDRLRAIQRSIGEGKQLLQTMKAGEIPLFTNVVAMPMMLPIALRAAGRGTPVFNVTVSNVPGPRQQLYWNGAALEGMYPLSIVADGLGLNITVTSCSDSLDFGIVACRRSVPRAQRLIDHLEAALTELERVVNRESTRGESRPAGGTAR